MSLHQSLGDLLSAQDFEGEDADHLSSASELELYPQRPASTPPQLAVRTRLSHDTTSELQDGEEVTVVPSLRSEDLAGRIRSYEGMLWRRNVKGRAKGWTRSWFKVAPGTSMGQTDCSNKLF